MFELDYKPHTILHYLSYFMAVWFLFLLVVGESRFKVTSFVLSAAWIVYSIIMYNDLLPESMSRVQQMGVLINIDGASALALTMFMFADRTAWKHSLILIFAVACHVVVSYMLTTGSSLGIDFVYHWYSELIILVCLLQLMVSHDGFIGAFDNVRALLCRFGFYCTNITQGVNLLVQKTRDK